MRILTLFRRTMRFRPCIDIHDGRVKQIVGSTLVDGVNPETNFTTSLAPSHFAKLYKNDSVPGGHVIMLGKGNEDAAIDALTAYPGGLQVGGGITPDNAGTFLDAGASHVIVTSYVFSGGKLNREHLRDIKNKVGRGRLVLDLSCRKRGDGYVIVTDRWQRETDELITNALLAELGSSCDEFLIHAAHVEGMRQGVDRELVALLHSCTDTPVTYAGGVRDISDLEVVHTAGNGAVDVTIGSALDLFGGALSYRNVISWFAHQEADHAQS